MTSSGQVYATFSIFHLALYYSDVLAKVKTKQLHLLVFSIVSYFRKASDNTFKNKLITLMRHLVKQSVT